MNLNATCFDIILKTCSLWNLNVNNQVSYVKLYILGILLRNIIWPAQNSAIITRNSRLLEEAHMYNTNSESIYLLFLSY